MLRQIVITFVVGTPVSVLTAFVYSKYFHRCGPSPDSGPGLRLLVKAWEAEAARHRRGMTEHAGDDVAYSGHQEAWLAYSVCAKRLSTVLQGGGAARARPAGDEQSLAEPVRIVGAGPP